jgi:hypothetical protein
MWRCVDLALTDVSEERISSIFRVENSASAEPEWAGGYRLQTAATCSRWFRTRGFLYPEDGGEGLLSFLFQTQGFGNWICFRREAQGRKVFTQLDPLERASLNRRQLFLIFLHLNLEKEAVSETCLKKNFKDDVHYPKYVIFSVPNYHHHHH